jgi:hypothetical protein
MKMPRAYLGWDIGERVFLMFALDAKCIYVDPACRFRSIADVKTTSTNALTIELRVSRNP